MAKTQLTVPMGKIVGYCVEVLNLRA